MTWLNCYRMRLVLIGFIISGFLSTASVCSPVEYFWTQKTDMPTPRWMPTSAIVNSKIYVIGGVSSEPDSEILSTVEEYDPVTNTWTRKADMPTPRGWIPPSSPVVDGKIYVIGGGDDIVWDLPTVEEYDPATDTWTQKADMPTPRWCLATCAVDGKIYAIGGAPNYYKGLGVVEEYDPVTDTWTRKADKPTGVWGLCADVVNDKIYAFGGRTGMVAGRIVEKYDPATDTWTLKSDMLMDRSNMASIVLGDKIFVIGGWVGSNSTPYKSVQVYDTLIDEWTEVASLPGNRSSLTACVLNNKIYAIGGTNNRHPCPAMSTVYELSVNARPDFNGDGIVDSADICLMVDYWHTDEPLYDIAPPPFGDGIVDVQDLIVLAEHLFEDYRLIAHWKLDETEGDIAYDSARTNDAAVLGDPVWQPDGGVVDGAIAFDGIDDYIDAPFVLNPRDGEFSVFAWINGGAPGQAVISQTDGTGFGRTGRTWLGLDPLDGKLFTTLMLVVLKSESEIADGDWHHLGLVWDGLHRHLYLDGAEVAQDASALSLVISCDGGLKIGADKELSTSSYWSGLIDDVRIYKVALSAEEVAALAQ